MFELDLCMHTYSYLGGDKYSVQSSIMGFLLFSDSTFEKHIIIVNWTLCACYAELFTLILPA